MTDGNLIRRLFKESLVYIFMVRWILVGNGFWVVNTWRAHGRKRLKKSTSNFCTHISNSLLHKTVSAFSLTTSYFCCCCCCCCCCFNNWRVLKAYFSWKQWKIDYSKNIWIEGNRGQSLVCPMVGYITARYVT